MQTHTLKTSARCELVNISQQVRDAITESGVRNGICVVFCPHTTGAITINENADPDVVSDLLDGLVRIAPSAQGYRHAEGNSDAHIKTSLVGPSEHIIIENGAPTLGTWQGIFFCEFDGPRTRKFHIQVQSE